MRNTSKLRFMHANKQIIHKILNWKNWAAKFIHSHLINKTHINQSLWSKNSFDCFYIDHFGRLLSHSRLV